MLFDPLTLRDLTIRNRVWMPPMCQYMVDAQDGKPTDWHFVHYGARAAQGFGLLVIEATGVSPQGRITPGDLGLWNDSQIEPFRRIVDFAHTQDTAIAVQLQHSGRKGSSWPDNPRFPGGVQLVDQGGWVPVGPTEVPSDDWTIPHALTTAEVAQIPELFAQAAIRADKAGIDVAEIHGAHGYLLHQFYSPLTNTRSDIYGGDFEGRTRLIREVTQAVRAVWPDSKPLFVRLSATDWVDGGWSEDDTVRLAKDLKSLGVDLIDVSTGGNITTPIPIGPGYQVRFAQKVRAEAEIPTTAVGLIAEPLVAEQILRSGQADAIMIGREALRNPGWPEQAAAALGEPTPMAEPYRRGQAHRAR